MNAEDPIRLIPSLSHPTTTIVDLSFRRALSPARRRIAVGSTLLAFVLGFCVAGGARGANDEKAAAALDQGLAFLAARQNVDGSVGDNHYRGGVGVTSLAGLAMLGVDVHADRVKQIAKFILSCQKEDGFITGDAERAGSMYDHGYATLFLAEYWKAASQPGVRESLTKAVDLIVKSQGKEGGWRYRPSPADGDTSVSACQLMALAAARDAGVEVPAATISAGVAFLKRCQNPDGGFGYTTPGTSAYARSAAALSATLATSKWTEPASQPDATKGAEYVMLFLPQADAGPKKNQFFIHGNFYANQALQIAGGDAWKRWHEAVRDHLIANQQADGSWADGPSAELATSEACLTLRSQKAAPPK